MKVWLDKDKIYCEYDSGRIGSLNICDYPRLYNVTPDQRESYNLSPRGIHWNDIDESISFDGLFDKDKSSEGIYNSKNEVMKNELDENIMKMIEEFIKSRMSNQQATITFNLEDFDAQRRLKKMLDVDKYVTCLYDMTQLFRRILKYESEKAVRHETYDGKYEDIILDYNTVEYISNQFYRLLGENSIGDEELYE